MNPFWLLRAVHILVAALWLGAAAVLSLYVMPSIRNSAGGGAVLGEIVRRGLPKFMASLAGLTVLTGALAYAMWTRLGGPGAVHSTAGILLALGALAGVGAMIIGGAIIAPTVKRLAALAEQGDAASSSDVAALHARGATAARSAFALLVIALLLMASSHFG